MPAITSQEFPSGAATGPESAGQLLSEDTVGPDGLDEAMGEEEAGPIYPFRHAVPMRQSRRMRSNEVHYLDHPLLGVVIKFTPVTADELAVIAEQQSSWDQSEP